MAALEALMDGATLVNQKGENVPLSSITGKSIGLYFSAHWCPPCRGFTPTLVEFYKKVRDTPAGAGFEIIFISFDRDLASFKSYFDTMPWLALKFEDLEGRKDDLSDKFNVKGIPTLVVIDKESGAVKDPKGRGTVEGNKDGTFPSAW